MQPLNVSLNECSFLCTVPSSPVNVTIASKTSTSLLVEWVSPVIPNGVLTSYEVTYTGVTSVNPVPESFVQPLSIAVSAPNTSLVLSDLVPYSNYTISVRAFTNAGPGEYSEVIEDRTVEDGERLVCCHITTLTFKLNSRLLKYRLLFSSL